MVGISPSYLNLIEHNRRRIGGKLLNDIARALGSEAAQLTEGAEGPLIEALRAAAAADPGADAELPRIEDFAARFPGWAGLIAAQARRIAHLEARITELADRLTHDPDFATALHQVISAVTSIRSTASILMDDSAVDADWMQRFHRNIYEDSLRLADQSGALIRYLQGPGEDGGITRSAPDDVGRFLEGLDHHVAALEGVRHEEEAALRAEVVAGLDGMTHTRAARLLDDWLMRYTQDARALPLAAFEAAARVCDHDPARLAAEFGVPLAQVLRRLATLPPGHDHPEMGLAVVDAAGGLVTMKPAGGFVLPRSGPACPLWPVFTALGQPGRPIRARVRLPGPTGAELLAHAVAEPTGPPDFDQPPRIRATMLVRPAREGGPDGPVVAVGTTCRICPRTDCAARREPSILG